GSRPPPGRAPCRGECGSCAGTRAGERRSRKTDRSPYEGPQNTRRASRIALGPKRRDCPVRGPIFTPNLAIECVHLFRSPDLRGAGCPILFLIEIRKL